MNREEIKKKILDSIKYAREELQFTLITDDWGSLDDQCACAMGCLVLSEDEELPPFLEMGKRITSLLGVSKDWINSFTIGFDGHPETDVFGSFSQEAYDLGKEIAAETNPMNYDEFESGMGF